MVAVLQFILVATGALSLITFLLLFGQTGAASQIYSAIYAACFAICVGFLAITILLNKMSSNATRFYIAILQHHGIAATSQTTLRRLLPRDEVSGSQKANGGSTVDLRQNPPTSTAGKCRVCGGDLLGQSKCGKCGEPT